MSKQEPVSPDMKARIDAMSHEEMARLWRFAAVGSPLFRGSTGKYFARRFSALGGMTAEVSKRIGWEE